MAHLDGQLLDVAQFAFAQRSDLAQSRDLAGHVRKIARREEEGQVVVVLVVAVGFAHHFTVLRPVAFERRREIAGHAVRAGDLLAQEAGLLFGFVEQLVPGVDLARQAADPLLGGRTAFLEFRDLPFLGGDPLFEGRDDLLLRLDAVVRSLLGHGGEGEEQECEGRYAEESHGRIIRRFWRSWRVVSAAVRSVGRHTLFRGRVSSKPRP